MNEGTGVRIAKDLTGMVNIIGNSHAPQDFVDYIMNDTHRTLQQGVFRIIVMLIRQGADDYHNRCYDGRNEASMAMCAKIIEKLDDRDLILPTI